jgi:hypothetical protein
MAEGDVISPVWFCFSNLQRDLASITERGYKADSEMGNKVKDKKKRYKDNPRVK